MCFPSEIGSMAVPPGGHRSVVQYVCTKPVFIVLTMIIVTNRSIIRRCIFGPPFRLIVHKVIVGKPIHIMFMIVVCIMIGVVST